MQDSLEARTLNMDHRQAEESFQALNLHIKTRRARLAMLESDSSLRLGLRRCLSLGASAHSKPNPKEERLCFFFKAHTIRLAFAYLLLPSKERLF